MQCSQDHYYSFFERHHRFAGWFSVVCVWIFVSLSDSANPDGTFTVGGELTIKGITKAVTATGTVAEPVTDPYGNERSDVELTAKVDRRDWGMDFQAQMPAGGDVLSYEVTITAQLEIVKES